MSEWERDNINDADDSWPAFPQHPDQGNMQFWRHGISMRDYFAGQALAGGTSTFFNSRESWDTYEEFAESCYRMADAMLRERQRQR